MGESKRKIVFYGISFANFAIAPFYYLSRVFNMLFPFMILGTVCVDGLDLFDVNEVDLFQCIMLLLYLFSILMCGIFSAVVYYEHYHFWHIMPGRSLWSAKAFIKSKNFKKLAVEKYGEMICIPVRNSLVNKKFGEDIGKIVIYYCDSIDV